MAEPLFYKDVDNSQSVNINNDKSSSHKFRRKRIRKKGKRRNSCDVFSVTFDKNKTDLNSNVKTLSVVGNR